MKFCCCFLLLTLTLCSLLASQAAGQNASDPAAAIRAQAATCAKQRRAGAPGPISHRIHRTGDQRLLCFRQGRLPAGVQSVAFQEQPGIVVGTSRVDFDQLKAGKNSYNPLLSVFSGVHEVVVTAHAYGANGRDWSTWIRFRSTASRSPDSYWNCSSKNTSSRSIRRSASTPALRCRPAWMRRPSGCTKSP